MANPTNLYEYYTKDGGKYSPYGSATRTADAKRAGIKDYTGTASQNNELLAYLTSSNSATDPKSTFVNNVAQLPKYSGPAGQTPEEMARSGANGTPTNQPQLQTPADKAFSEYLSSLSGTTTISPEQQMLQEKLNTQTTDAQLAEQRALNSGETMGFAGGEAQRVGRNNAITIAGTAAQLQARQAFDQSRASNLTGVAKARYEYEQAKLNRELEQNKPFELSAGQTRYDSKGNVIASVPANQATQSTGFTLQPGEKRFDAQGNLIASVAPKVTNTSPKFVYETQDAMEDRSELEASRGSDNYVNPQIYLQLYEGWIARGGKQSDFLKTFPPKDFVNPENKWLPTFLVPKKESGFSY